MALSDEQIRLASARACPMSGMRNPRFTIRVQQRFRNGAGIQVDDPDVNVRENFSGIDPRFAGAGHQLGNLFAETGAFVGIGRTESSAVA